LISFLCQPCRNHGAAVVADTWSRGNHTDDSQVLEVKKYQRISCFWASVKVGGTEAEITGSKLNLGTPGSIS